MYNVVLRMEIRHVSIAAVLHSGTDLEVLQRRGDVVLVCERKKVFIINLLLIILD